MSKLQPDWTSAVRIPHDMPCGDADGWRIERFEIDPQGAAFYNFVAGLSLMGSELSPRPVRPGTYTRLMGPSEHAVGEVLTWMSDTDAEIEDHAEFFESMVDAESVLVNGLGIGLCVSAAIALDTSVKTIDIVDNCRPVIDLVAPYWKREAKRHGIRLNVFEHDAFLKTWPDAERWDLAWHDIWPTISADNLPEMDKLEAKYETRVGWQGSWLRQSCETMKPEPQGA